MQRYEIKKCETSLVGVYFANVVFWEILGTIWE